MDVQQQIQEAIDDFERVIKNLNAKVEGIYTSEDEDGWSVSIYIEGEDGHEYDALLLPAGPYPLRLDK